MTDVTPPRPARVDRLARALAQSAGVRWDALANYPGYTKALWREQAAAILSNLDSASSTPVSATPKAIAPGPTVP